MTYSKITESTSITGEVVMKLGEGLQIDGIDIYSALKKYDGKQVKVTVQEVE